MVDIKDLRNKLRLSQDKLAAQIGVSPFTVRRWESGKSKPSPLALEKLVKLKEVITDCDKISF